MFTDSVFESSKSLANILFSADLAGDAVDQVRASATNVEHSGVFFVGGVAGDFATFVEKFAVFAK